MRRVRSRFGKSRSSPPAIRPRCRRRDVPRWEGRTTRDARLARPRLRSRRHERTSTSRRTTSGLWAAQCAVTQTSAQDFPVALRPGFTRPFHVKHRHTAQEATSHTAPTRSPSVRALYPPIRPLSPSQRVRRGPTGARHHCFMSDIRLHVRYQPAARENRRGHTAPTCSGERLRVITTGATGTTEQPSRAPIECFDLGLSLGTAPGARHKHTTARDSPILETRPALTSPTMNRMWPAGWPGWQHIPAPGT